MVDDILYDYYPARSLQLETTCPTAPSSKNTLGDRSSPHEWRSAPTRRAPPPTRRRRAGTPPTAPLAPGDTPMAPLSQAGRSCASRRPSRRCGRTGRRPGRPGRADRGRWPADCPQPEPLAVRTHDGARLDRQLAGEGQPAVAHAQRQRQVVEPDVHLVDAVDRHQLREPPQRLAVSTSSTIVASPPTRRAKSAPRRRSRPSAASPPAPRAPARPRPPARSRRAAGRPWRTGRLRQSRPDGVEVLARCGDIQVPRPRWRCLPEPLQIDADASTPAASARRASSGSSVQKSSTNELVERERDVFSVWGRRHSSGSS